MNAYDKHMLADDSKILEGERFEKCKENYVDGVERGIIDDWIYNVDQEDAQVLVMQLYAIAKNATNVCSRHTAEFEMGCKFIEMKCAIEQVIAKAATAHAERHYNDPDDQFEFDDDC